VRFCDQLCLTLRSPVEPAHESTKHPLDLDDRVHGLFLYCFSDECQVTAENRFAFELASRAHGNVQEPPKFAVSPPATSFGDVCAIETLARRICAFNPNSSLAGKILVSS